MQHDDAPSGRKTPELLLPAGSPSKLQMALLYGADAVYVGAAGLSMRPDQASFDVPALEQAVADVHARDKRIYVAANSLLQREDLRDFERWIKATAHIGFDALILSDLGALALCRERRPELAVHISTQLSVANYRAAALLGQLGVKRVILARECTLDDAKEIAERSGLEVEVFVHGAMCVAVSGRCLLSAHLSGKSGNKGSCKHSCRWEWQLVEQKRPGESLPVFETGRETILLGSKDLCLIDHLPQVIETGVCSLKVEGRMKSEYYVATIARAYRAALDAHVAGQPFDPRWRQELEAVSHRPFSTGFAFGYPEDEPASLQTHNRPVSDCQLMGYVDAIADGRLTIRVKYPFSVGDTLEWIGPEDRQGTLTIERIFDEQHSSAARALSGGRDRDSSEALGGEVTKTISATVVSVNARIEGDEIVPHTIIRKRVR
jgi:putative protease